MRVSQIIKIFVSIIIIGGAILIVYQQYVTITGGGPVNDCISTKLERRLDFLQPKLSQGIVSCEYSHAPVLWWGTISYVVFLFGLVFVPGITTKKEKKP